MADISSLQSYDLGVIGGGPAGVTAACVGARLGAMVVLLDKGCSRGPDEVAPVHVRSLLVDLAMELTDMFGELGRIKRYTTGWGSHQVRSRSTMLSACGDDFAINRERFAAALSTCAQTHGVEWKHTSVSRIERHGATQFLVHGSGGILVACNRLVIAVGRALFAPLRGNSVIRTDRTIALYPRTITPRSDPHELIVEAAPHGWWYTLHGADDQETPVLLTDADGLPTGRTARQAWFLARLRETQLLSLRQADDRTAPVDLYACTAGTCARATPCGPGWVLAGDGRIALDPLSGNGLLRAVQDGANAARFVIGDPCPRDRRAYELRHGEEFGGLIQRRRAYYRRERRFDTAFWRSRQHR